MVYPTGIFSKQDVQFRVGINTNESSRHVPSDFGYALMSLPAHGFTEPAFERTAHVDSRKFAGTAVIVRPADRISSQTHPERHEDVYQTQDEDEREGPLWLCNDRDSAMTSPNPSSTNTPKPLRTRISANNTHFLLLAYTFIQDIPS